MGKGLFNPKNFETKGGGGKFKEGLVRVDKAAFKVQHPTPGEGQEDRGAFMALVWNVTRLDESHDPIIDGETDEPMTEELAFGLGGKSLAFIHPGKGDSPSDEEVEDLGDADETEGNTIYFLQEGGYKLDTRSGASILMASLSTGRDKQFKGCGLKEEFLNREWAPDWVGCVFEMKPWVDESNKIADQKDKSKEYGIKYKLVTKVIVGPGEAKKGKVGKEDKKPAGKKAAAEKSEKPAAADKSASNGAGDYDKSARTLMNKMSEEFDTQRLTMKEFLKQCSAKLDADKFDTKTKIGVMQVYKNEEWLGEHASDFDMVFDAEGRTITFGELAEAA